MKKILYIVALLNTFFVIGAIAQDGEYITVRDFESWNAIGVKYNLKSNLSFGLEEQLRLNNNASDIDAFLTEINAEYGITDNIRGAIGFRYYRENDLQGDVQGFENHVRLHFDLAYNYEKERLSIDYRLRLQAKNELGVISDQGDYTNKNLRFKVGLKYNIRKWKLDPEFSSEIFRRYEAGEQTDFNKFRITFGTRYKLNKFGKIGAFYRLEKGLLGSYPQTTNIIGLKYSYTINKDKKGAKKKKKKKSEDEELIWY